MKKLLPAIILFAFCSFTFSSQDDSEAKVISASKMGLSTWLSKIPVGQETSFGFSNRGEFANATVGKPYQTITFSPEFYKTTDVNLENLIISQNEWREPVIANGSSRLLLTVNFQNADYQVNDMGGMGLAKELEMRNTFGTTGNNFILRVYPLALDFMVHTDTGKNLAQGIYIPMNSAKNAIASSNAKDTFSQVEILKMVKEKLNEQAAK